VRVLASLTNTSEGGREGEREKERGREGERERGSGGERGKTDIVKVGKCHLVLEIAGNRRGPA